MSVGVNGVSNYTGAYGTTATSAAAAETAKENTAASAVESKESDGVVYEKGSQNTKKATYSVNKMSKEDRAALVEQLKNDQAAREQSLLSLVNKMISKQGTVYSQADDSFWKFIASGNYTVDAETKAQAQKDIAEDGYWGVKQTSQRLFDFASALAGDDVDKMKEMQAAVEKGYKLAEKAWGGELPGISQDTLKATNKLFDDYYASKETDAVA